MRTVACTSRCRTEPALPWSASVSCVRFGSWCRVLGFRSNHCLWQQHTHRRLTCLHCCAQILYCSGVWSYIVASIATPTFIIVPLATIWIGIFPIVLSMDAAIGLSAYYLATVLVSFAWFWVPLAQTMGSVPQRGRGLG